MRLVVGTRKILHGVIDVVAALFLLTGCGGAGKTGQAYAISTPNVTQVIVSGREFKPSIITIPAGTTVSWTNHGGETHTVTSSSGLFYGVLGPVSGSFNYTFNQSGSYEYHCDIFDYHIMTGRVDVQ